jgi:ATP-binding cassette, subfamily F, member 3
MPVNIASLAANNVNEVEAEMKSIWVNTREDGLVRNIKCIIYHTSERNSICVQKVDQKKLDKAQAKLQQKQDKRSNEIFKVIAPKLETASASQVQSKKETKMESKGTNRATDVRIENFDIAYGDK